VNTVQPTAVQPPLRMLIADRDDVADELVRRRIPVSTLEIDTRPPITGRLVLGGADVVGPETPEPVSDRLTLDWRQDLGWSVGTHANLASGKRARPACLPTAEPAAVADFLQSSDAL
jgi:hypothetical protein